MIMGLSSTRPVAQQQRQGAATGLRGAAAVVPRGAPTPRGVAVRVSQASMDVMPDHVRAAIEETQARRAELRQEMAAMRRSTQEQPAEWWEVDCPANMINVSTAAQLSSTVDAAAAAGKLAVVCFFSPECYACRSMQPKLRQMAAGAAADGVLFLKVNGHLDGLREYCEGEGITMIPFFRFYRHGSIVAEFSANMSPEKLSLLRRQLALHSRPGADAGAAAELGAAVARA